MPISDRDVLAMQKRFLRDQREFLATPEGKETLQATKAFTESLRTPGGSGLLDERMAGKALDWVARMPEKLASADEAPLLNPEELTSNTARGRALAQGLEMLNVSAQALLAGGAAHSQRGLDDLERLADAVVLTALGGEGLSRGLRKPILDDKLPSWMNIEGIDAARIEKLVRGGALNKLVIGFAECGVAAQSSRDWLARVQPLGEVLSLQPPRACPGQKLVISYRGFGASAPAAGSRVAVALPTVGSCTHVLLDPLQPGSPWSDSGSIEIELPADISTGPVGFFLLPPPMDESGPCGPGHLLGLAGEWQEVLTQGFGAAGLMQGRKVVETAARIEAARLPALPCATVQANQANLLRAGAPIIHRFRVIETGPVHPRGTLTVEWSVQNADAVAIYPRSTPDSPNTHEIPNLPVPLATMGRVLLQVPCTRRWSATIVLEASNANACGVPVRAEVRVESGFSHWLLGVGKADVTDRRPGLGMAGFAYERQRTDGRVQLDDMGREMPQFARAFCIRENRASGDRRELVLVVADIWTGTIALKRELLKRLNIGYPATNPRFRDDNLLVAGTHTHAGPGGYSEYPLYNLTLGGFDQGVFDTILGGLVTAVEEACNTAVRGRLFVNNGPVQDCGANRSLEAYRRNPEAAGAPPGEWTDREMLLLRFQADPAPGGQPRELGALNWYAIHPTSLGMFNRVISGDNKGWAEMLFEREMSQTAGAGNGFVAAFGNGNAGDVSGNVTLDNAGNKSFVRPMGGTRPEWVVPVPMLTTDPNAAAQDQNRMRMLGQRQFEHAKALFDSAGFELTGRLDSRHCWVDMSNEPIAAVPGAKTWPAALGVSFGAGSSEDSIAYASLLFLDVDASVMEGYVKADHTPSGIAFTAAVAAQVITSPGAVIPLLTTLTTGVPLGPAGLLSAWPLVAGLLAPGPRSYGAALIASLSFAGKIPVPPKRTDGDWKWAVDMPIDVPPDMEQGHGAKPIMFVPGKARLKFVPLAGRGAAATEADYPLVPQVLPMQLLRIGSLAVAGVPAEFTGMAGRRLKATLRQALPNLSHVAISNYSNGYSGYVSTREEYSAQHYEGASTLYGEYTLMAYQQRFEALAQALLSGGQAPSAAAPAQPQPLAVEPN